MGLTFRGEAITSEQYKNICNQILNLQIDVSHYFSLPISELRWHHYKTYAENELNYFFTFYDYGNLVGNKISGRTTFIDGCISIIINTNWSQTSERQHFTILHEISHGLCHITPLLSGPLFSKNIPAPNDISAENEADILGSVMMVSDAALEKAMEERITFKDFCHRFGCSQQGAYRRLLNYLVFNLEYNELSAVKIVRNYENYDSKVICDIVFFTNPFQFAFFESEMFDGIMYVDYSEIKKLVFEFAGYDNRFISNSAAEYIARDTANISMNNFNYGA